MEIDPDNSGAKRPRRNLKRGHVYTVDTSNRFDKLTDQKVKPKAKDSGSIPKPPPIIVTDSKFNPSEAFKVTKVNLRIKLISIGVKLFGDTSTDYDKIINLLKEQQIEFFTHGSSSEQTFKSVLRGLPEIPIDTIASCLAWNNVKPCKITMFKTSSPNKIYLVEFNKGAITKSDLAKIRTVYHHVVQWESYIKTKKGPTQCRNCGMFGHGISNCNRLASCLLCGEKHAIDKCPLTVTDAAEIVYKCMNCAKNNLPHSHRSDNDACPSRKRYMELRSSANKPKNKTVHYTNNSARSSPTFNTTTTSTPRTHSSQSYANAFKFGSSNSVHDTNNDNNTLWSFEEVSDILFNSISELEACKSKFDQLRVIANLLKNACK